jgi:xyloglucan fucosyltransferase
MLPCLVKYVQALINALAPIWLLLHALIRIVQKQSVSFLCPVQSQHTSRDRIDTTYNRHIHFDEVLTLEEDLQVPKGFSLKEDMSPSFAKFQTHNCKGPGESYYCRSSRDVVEVVISGVSRPTDHTFLVCPSAMAAVREVPFLNFRNSNQYFAAGFFLNPALRSLLERMFPAHNVFHILAQTFLSPSDAVWEQIKSFHEQFLQPASRNVGIQLRESKGEYRQYYDDVVPLCIKSKVALCPIELEEELKINRKSSWPLVSLYVSSLAGGHFITLNQTAPNLGSEMRQRFVVLEQVKFTSLFLMMMSSPE